MTVGGTQKNNQQQDPRRLHFPRKCSAAVTGHLTHTVSVSNTTRRVKRTNIITARYRVEFARKFRKKASVYKLASVPFPALLFPQSSRGETERAGTFHANFTVHKRAGYRSDGVTPVSLDNGTTIVDPNCPEISLTATRSLFFIDRSCEEKKRPSVDSCVRK